MKQPLPKPPAKLPPRGGPMSPPPVRAPMPRGPVAAPPKAPTPVPLAARAPTAPAPKPPSQAGSQSQPIPAGRPHPAIQTPPRTSANSSPPRAGANPPPRAGANPPPRPGSPAGIERTARVAAAGAAGTVSAVIEAVRLVDTVLAEENLVLRRHDAAGAAALQERKMAAARLYHERMRALTRDTEATRSMSLEQRTELVTIARGLDERVRENAILLKATMDSIDRLFGCINQAAQQKANKEVSYSRAGMVAPSASPAAASIAFNRTV